ncbi:hypothetical protein KI387_030164, partial [Taxus chinensis]
VSPKKEAKVPIIFHKNEPFTDFQNSYMEGQGFDEISNHKPREEKEAMKHELE